MIERFDENAREAFGRRGKHLADMGKLSSTAANCCGILSTRVSYTGASPSHLSFHCFRDLRFIRRGFIAGSRLYSAVDQ